MNILLVTETYLPYISGVASSTDSIARYMASQGHKVIIANPKPITKGDVDFMTSVPGIGKKTAQRIIVELKEKLSKSYNLEIVDDISLAPGENESTKDAVSALMALGYSAKEARVAVMASIETNGEAKIEEIIKQSLRNLSSS